MSEIITVGLDLAKNEFRVDGSDRNGSAILRRKLRRAPMLDFFAKLPPCLVAIEVCGGAIFLGAGIVQARPRYQAHPAAHPGRQCNTRTSY